MFNILAHADNYAVPTRSMQYAAQAAILLDASLTGIFIAEPVLPMAPMNITPVVPEIYAAAAEIVNAALAAEPKFCEWAKGAGVARYKWQVATGFLSAALQAAGNWHDVLVLGCGGGTPWTSVGMLGHELVTCGLPCFVVPETFERTASFESIAIASHGSPESVRAVHAALPLLARAKRITLIKGKPREAFSLVDFRPGFSIEEHLRNHGIRFATNVLDAPTDNPGAAILAAAGEAGADLLVMGAYGRARFAEWVLGGVTRHVLENAHIPLFLRH